MKKRAGLVGVTLGALGCGEPVSAPELRPQELFSRNTVARDSLEGEAWRKFLKASELHAAWAPPAGSPWRPFYKPTLVAAVSVVESAAGPVRSDEANVVELAASRFAEGVNLQESAVIVDLPGEQSVAWGALLRRKGFQPVPMFNNWPHQRGLVRLERPLGALLYYAGEASRSKLPDTAPPVFLLEGTRLSRKDVKPSAEIFDNRYFHTLADFPSASVLAARQIRKIYYVTLRGTSPGAEEDDLSDYFTSLARAGMRFSYVSARPASFEIAEAVPAARQTIFSPAAASPPPNSNPYYRRSYYPHHYFWSRSPGGWGGGWSGSSRGGGSGFSS